MVGRSVVRYRWNVFQKTFISAVLCSQLTSATWDFNEQVERLIANVSMSEEKLHSLSQVLQTVEDTMNRVWQGSKAMAYGSVVFGTAFVDSDIDISVALPASAYTNNSGILDTARIALENAPHLYQNVRVKTLTRLPVIKLYFVPSEIYCDITVHKNIGKFEAELVRYMLHVDERALKLAILIKLWGKRNMVMVKRYINNYNLVLLVIFYLQQRLLLPAVVELQHNVAPDIVDGIDYSNVAFERKILQPRNNETLYELLGGFFEYYENFDFDKYIICPFTGQPVERKLFKNIDDVPEVFSVYKFSIRNNMVKPLNISTAMCIQDILVHSDSCAKKVDATTLNIISKTIIGHSANVFRETHKDDFLTAVMGL